MVRTRLLISIFIAVGLLAAGMAFAVSRSSPKGQAVTQSSGVITGRVFSADGQPVSAVSVYAEKSDVTFGRLLMFPTNDEGEFSIPNLTPGTYKVSAAKEDEGFPPTDSPFYSAGFVETPRVNVYEGQTTLDVTVYLGAKAAKLTGRILDATTNKPIKQLQGVQIALRRVDNPDLSYTFAADLEGEFSILVPPVPCEIEVSAPGYGQWNNGRKAIHLTPSATKEVSIHLRPAR